MVTSVKKATLSFMKLSAIAADVSSRIDDK
jgi:hypothetical protein